MNMRKLISGSVIAALAVALTPTDGIAAMAVEQQDYTFRMEITRDITASTFVIGESTGTTPLRPPALTPASETNLRTLALHKRERQEIKLSRTIIPPILFGLADATLAEDAKGKILATLPQKVGKKTPLQVRGYTCDLGSQQYNDALALRRAKAVAELLRSHGYKVAAVTGKGRQDYVSQDPARRYLNRRAEIGILSRPEAPEKK